MFYHTKREYYVINTAMYTNEFGGAGGTDYQFKRADGQFYELLDSYAGITTEFEDDNDD